MSTIQKPSTRSATGVEHYVSLDSLRGICACAVVLYHMTSTGRLVALPFFRKSWLFVDFFFVLSGFVIAASYGERLARGFSIKRFMTLRLGRVYPLHLVTLLVLLCFELAKYVVGATEGPNAPFTGNALPGAFLTNLTLTQIFGFHDSVLWNSPSWSIAAEVWTYLIAALGLSLLGRRFGYALVATAILSPVILALIDDQGLDRTYSWALIRCIYGFSLGMIAYALHRRFAGIPIGGAAMTAAEAAIAGITIIALSYAAAGRTTLIFPPFFMLAVIAFAREGGGVSRVLATKPFRTLGALSYSIYMIHVLVIQRFMTVAGVVGGIAHVKTTEMVFRHGGLTKALSGAGIMPDVLTLICLGLVIACAWPSYRFIEIPFRDMSRRLAKRIGEDRAGRGASDIGQPTKA